MFLLMLFYAFSISNCTWPFSQSANVSHSRRARLGWLGWLSVGFALAGVVSEACFQSEFQVESSATIKMTCSDLRWSKFKESKISQSAPDFTSLNSCQLLVCALLGFALSSVAVFCHLSILPACLPQPICTGPSLQRGWGFLSLKNNRMGHRRWGRTKWQQCSCFCVGFQISCNSFGSVGQSSWMTPRWPTSHGNQTENSAQPQKPEAQKEKKTKLKFVMSSLKDFQLPAVTFFFGSCRGNGGSISCVRLTMNCVPVWKALTGKLISSEETK